MVMAMELARLIHQERLEEAETRRRRKALKDQAKKLAAAKREQGPKVEWPVFSLRIGRFSFVAFRTVRLWNSKSNDAVRNAGPVRNA